MRAVASNANGLSCLSQGGQRALSYDHAQTALAPPLGLRAMSRPDEAALERLAEVFRRDARWVFALLRRFGVEATDAEDVTQEVFLVLRARLGEVALGEERKFLFRTATYQAANARRRARRRPLSAPSDADELTSRSDAERELSERDELALLQQILNAMPEDLRVAFVLYEIEEMTVPEIAAILTVPLGTAKSRLLRARHSFEREAKRRGVKQDAAGGAARSSS